MPAQALLLKLASNFLGGSVKFEGTQDLSFRVDIDTEDLLDVLRSRREKSRKAKKRKALTRVKFSSLQASFIGDEHRLIISGRVRNVLPVAFAVRSGSRTYRSILKLAVQEFGPVTWEKNLADVLRSQESAQRAVRQLASLGKTTSHHHRKQRDSVHVFSKDIELLTTSELLHDVPIKGLRSLTLASSRRGRAGKHIALQLVPDLLDESGTISAEKILDRCAQSFHFVEKPKCSVRRGGVTVKVRFAFDSSLLPHVGVYLRYGRYDASPSDWRDEEVSARNVRRLSPGMCELRTTITTLRAGGYGVTMYLRPRGNYEKLWLSAPQIGDGTFVVPTDFVAHKVTARTRNRGATSWKDALENYAALKRQIHLVRKAKELESFRRFLFELSSTDVALRERISTFHAQVVEEISREKNDSTMKRLRVVEETLRMLGVGEVVFISPEGPQASAGGLAQVMNGLGRAMPRAGMRFTLISPLYEEAQGNRHRSAEAVLRDGLLFQGQRLRPRFVGEIFVSCGGTRDASSGEFRELPVRSCVQVYRADGKGVRLFFLRHRHLADRLYPSAYSDELLRRAIFLSRAALEVCRTAEFGLSPHMLVTNDWITALVPTLLKTDAVYVNDPVLANVECIHMLHNCGRGYQGRIGTHQFGVDLWPMFELSGEHFFGLKDPETENNFNLTAGALCHAGKALLAVSKPYAEQLCSIAGGEGLGEMFLARKQSVFGISNGIELDEVRRFFFTRGEESRSRTEGGIASYRMRKMLRRFPEYKRGVLADVQRKVGLTQRDDAILVSLIGRIAEQKGVALLAESAMPGGRSVLENVLASDPRVQVLLAGPLCLGDRSVERLVQLAAKLSLRYPGRLATKFEFLHHRDALEFTLASDIFLMPSRYEPGGISQLEALAAGALVVARNVGGIAATLRDVRPGTAEGNGFLFLEYSGQALWQALKRCLLVLQDEKVWKRVMRRGVLAENDWSHRIPYYISLFQHVGGVLDALQSYAHLAHHSELLKHIVPDEPQID